MSGGWRVGSGEWSKEREWGVPLPTPHSPLTSSLHDELFLHPVKEVRLPILFVARKADESVTAGWEILLDDDGLAGRYVGDAAHQVSGSWLAFRVFAPGGELHVRLPGPEPVDDHFVRLGSGVGDGDHVAPARERARQNEVVILERDGEIRLRQRRRVTFHRRDGESLDHAHHDVRSALRRRNHTERDILSGFQRERCIRLTSGDGSVWTAYRPHPRERRSLRFHRFKRGEEVRRIHPLLELHHEEVMRLLSFVDETESGETRGDRRRHVEGVLVRDHGDHVRAGGGEAALGLALGFRSEYDGNGQSQR